MHLMRLRPYWYAIVASTPSMTAAPPQRPQIDGGVCASEDVAVEACSKLAKLLGRDAPTEMATQYRALGGALGGCT